jgi:formate dehydrogenase subunit delta
MDANNLVRMANRIGDFFVAMPDRTEAIEGIANHIHKFWEPRMRREMYAHIDATSGADLQEIVLTALRQNRDQLN